MMGSRKRQKMSESNSVKRRKKSSEECQDLLQIPKADRDLLSSAENHEELYLSLLPNEVLLYIYKYLSPVDLASLSKLGIQRFTELTYTMREANFSSCRRDNPLFVSTFFSRSTVKYIQKLNFNYYFYIKAQDLANLICQCKNLISLSVVECGLIYNNIVNILRSCTKLEELAWNVGDVVQLLNISCPNMKRVYLFCDVKEVSLNSVYYTIKNFPKVENVWINFASDSISALPFIGVWLRTSCVSSIKLRRRYALITNSFYYFANASDLVLLSRILSCELQGKDNQLESSDTVRSKVYNCAPCLQIRSLEEDLALLSSGPFNAYTTLAIELTSEFVDTSEKLLKCVEEIAGNKLKHLLLQSEAYDYNDEGFVYPVSMLDDDVFLVCDLLEKMFLTSKYVTVLNLTTIHFSVGSPFKAILQLKYLKVLDLPSCAFCNTSKLRDEDEYVEFSTLVSSCSEIETFVLNCCLTDAMPITEEQVVPIRGWKHLKHLSVYNIIFRNCNFLQKVADSCMQLQSLSLISVAPKKVCLFTNDVIYLLKKAKNLSFLRINEGKFNPMFERFWSAIGEAVNLEGICIITQSNCAVDRPTVIRGIKNLKYLHLFHFFAPKASDRLYCEAKRSMLEHGIKNIKIEKFCNINSFNQSRVQYYHRQPNFCCQHLHIKDIDIF